jgi:hypothetical protein
MENKKEKRRKEGKPQNKKLKKQTPKPDGKKGG